MKSLTAKNTINAASRPEASAISVANRREPLAVAVIGCGAVARQMHLPVLAGHENIRLAALVDRDRSRAETVAREFGVGAVFTDASELKAAMIAGAIIATPPSHHAPCCINLMQSGIHVLVEKPMATRYADAVEMVKVAEEHGVVLNVGVFRRLYPSLRLLRGLLESEYLGRPRSFSLRSGAIYGWDAATLGNLQKDLAGGGILMDMGPHHLDQLLAIFDGPGEVLRYRDDAVGGCEANCEVAARFWYQGSPVEGEMVLSRTRSLRNSLKIECERGFFEVEFSERFRVRVVPDELAAKDVFDGSERPIHFNAEWEAEPQTDWYQSFRTQIDDWLNAILQGKTGRLSGKSCLPSMKLIDECYERKVPLPQRWAERSVFRAVVPKVRRVLITGASGFIGCRLAEAISQNGGCEVRAMVRKPAHAARLARLGVKMIQVDLRNREQVRAALEDCNAVVHCAVGTDYWSRRAVADVTIGGTRNLLDAALETGVKRFVHLSSIAVHDDRLRGVLNEDSPVVPRKHDHYGRTKLHAERLVQQFAAKGLPAVILRPGCVYGPYGSTFTIRPLEALEAGQLILCGSADTPANTVFVDNLVEAILRSLERAEELAGEVFTIGDDDSVTWGEFYGFFAGALNKPLRYEATQRHAGRSSALRRMGGLTDILVSTEFRGLARKALDTKPLGSPFRWLLDRSPTVAGWLKTRLGGGGATIYRPQTGSKTPEIRITPRFAEIQLDKAERLLAYRPLVSGAEARALTLEWWREWRSQ